MGLHSKLALETACEVTDAAAAVSRNIRYLPDVVKHVSTGEEENEDQADGSPHVSVLYDGEELGPDGIESGAET